MGRDDEESENESGVDIRPFSPLTAAYHDDDRVSESESESRSESMSASMSEANESRRMTAAKEEDSQLNDRYFSPLESTQRRIADSPSRIPALT